MTKKSTDIIAYITLIGWLIAYFAGTREESKFHLNQALVLTVANLIIMVLSNILSGWIFGICFAVLNILMFVLWVIGLIAAIQGQEKPVPVLGEIQLLK